MNSAAPALATPRSYSAGVGWALVGVLALAALLRVWGLTSWSMWEDEEGSLSLAQKPFVGFQGFFPVFFVALNQWLSVTGLSVGAARVLPALLGLLSIALTFVCFRRFVSPAAALLAALFLAVNLGHLFFSQSIRYYTTVLVFEILSLYWFLDGFERDRATSLVLSMVAFVLALWTHFSAVLLAPVFVGYLLLMLLGRETGAGYRARRYLLFGLLLGVVLVVFARQLIQLRNLVTGQGDPLASARDPVHVGITVVAYFGVPLVALALLAPWLARQLPRRVLRFFLVASFVPVLELLVIARMDVINVTWYYALFAVVGFALLAGAVLVGIWERGRQRTAALLSAAALLYYLAFLGGYYTTWHGDRPRWAEAAVYLRQTGTVEPGRQTNPPVFASVPGVVAYYLGADPRQPQTYRVAQSVPARPGETGGPAGCWYVVEAKLVSPAYQAWFEKTCHLEARFESRTGPIDRSVLVYRCKGKPDGAPSPPPTNAAQ
jgi:predicted membrane-bound mannosyltransferase